MDLNQILRNHASEPLTHQLLMSLLKDQMTKCKLPIQHILEPIKKGLYIAGPSLETVFPEPFLVINHILGQVTFLPTVHYLTTDWFRNGYTKYLPLRLRFRGSSQPHLEFLLIGTCRFHRFNNNTIKKNTKSYFSIFFLLVAFEVLAVFVGIWIGKGVELSKAIVQNEFSCNYKVNLSSGKSEDSYVFDINSSYYFYVAKGSKHIKIAPIGTISNLELINNRKPCKIIL